MSRRKGMCTKCIYMQIKPPEQTAGRSKNPMKFCRKYGSFCQQVSRNCPGAVLGTTQSKGETTIPGGETP